MRNMRFVLAIATLAILAVACAEKATEEALTDAPYYNSLAEAQEAIGSSDKPIIIDFYTDLCKWCARIDTVVLKDPKAIKFFSDEMALVKIDAGVDSATAKRYHVSGYPTLVMVNKSGEEIDRLVGYLNTGSFIKTFRDYAKGIGTLDDLLGRADTDASRPLYMEIAEKYKYRGGAEEAMVWFQKVIDEGDASDSLSGESRLALADMHRRAKDYEDAADAFKTIAKDFEGMPLAQDAEVWTAIVYRQMGDTAEAVKRFEAFVKHYPESEDVEYCQKQIKRLTEAPEEKPDSTRKKSGK